MDNHQTTYQEKTGQVAPVTQNPQEGNSQSYQQPYSTNLQSSNQGFLDGQTGLILVLPNGTSTVAPTGMIEGANNSHSANGFSVVGMLTVISVVIIWAVGVVLLYKRAKVDPEILPEIESDNVDVSQPIIITKDEPHATTNRTKPKKSKKSKKRKK